MSVTLEEYHDALSAATATELETVISEQRTRRSNQRRDRVRRIADALD